MPSTMVSGKQTELEAEASGAPARQASTPESLRETLPAHYGAGTLSGMVSASHILGMQRILGNRRVVQRLQRDAKPDTEPSPTLPADGDPVIEEDFDPVPEEATAETGGAAGQVSQSLQRRSSEGKPSVQRQAAAAPAVPPAVVVAKTLGWSDFTPVNGRQGGHSANTGWRSTWRTNGTGFQVTFSPAASWSYPPDQTPALLQHEQFHLNLAVLIANKANAAAGSMPAARLIREFRKAMNQHTQSYDGDTQHGTNPALQTAWEQDISKGIPEFPISG